MGFQDIIFAATAVFWLVVIVVLVRNATWWNS